MKKYLFISLSLAAAILAGASIFYYHYTKGPGKYKPRLESVSYEGEEGERGIDGAVKYLARMRNNQVTGKVDYSDIQKVLDQISAMPKYKNGNTIEWMEMGPDNVGGRCRAILFDRRNPNIVYAGGVSGGLWRSETGGSSWKQITLLEDSAKATPGNVNISCIAQGPDNVIYAGTGEGFTARAGIGNNTGFEGRGVYRSFDGINFSILPSTIPGSINGLNVWKFVNKIAVNPVNGWIFAATETDQSKGGLLVSKDNGKTWTNAIKYPGTQDYVHNATDIKIANDQTIVASVSNQCWLSTNGGETFINKSSGGFPAQSKVGRLEFAIAPSNTNYIYALVSATTGFLQGVYQSKDKGNTWTVIGPGGSTGFEIFGSNGQGWFDNVIAVFPDNPEHIFAAGVTLYEWKVNSTWLNKTNGINYPIHADIHAIVFHPNNPKICYIGTDGGVYRTRDGGVTFEDINRKFSVTQFYAMAFSGTDEVMGGTQDNGTQYISKRYNGDFSAIQVGGGDGGWCSFSLINPAALYVTLYYGVNLRNPDKTTGLGWQLPDDWYEGNFKNKWGMLSEGTDGNGDGKPDAFPASFVTPVLMWETFNDGFSKEYVTGKAANDYPAGTVVIVRSRNNSFPFLYTLKEDVIKDSTIKVIDKIQSRYFIAFNSEIWMTRGAADFSRRPSWDLIGRINGAARNLSVSQDGNHLFVGTETGNLYRLSNLRFAYDSLTGDVNSKYCVVSNDLLNNTTFSSGGRCITSVSVDPGNPAHIIVTLGNYGNSVYVYESRNALDLTPSFSQKQGNLPTKMPVYASLIEMNNTNTVLLGTDYGIFVTKDISKTSPVWEQMNEGMDNVPVFMLRQQTFKYDGDFVPTGVPAKPYENISDDINRLNVTNYGVIYAATHGRGIFKSETYKTSLGINDIAKKSGKPALSIYPNPVKDNLTIEFTLPKASDAEIFLYDMNGRKIKSLELQRQAAGPGKASLDVSDLPGGAYIVNIVAGRESASVKMVK